MPMKTIREQLVELTVGMANAQDVVAFTSLVKEMSYLLMVREMDHLLRAAATCLRGHPTEE